MRGRLPRYYYQQNEREGTVIEVKRDSRPFTGYEIVTMKLVERTPRADRQWLRWSLYRVEELCRNTAAVPGSFLPMSMEAPRQVLRVLSRSQSRPAILRFVLLLRPETRSSLRN